MQAQLKEHFLKFGQTLRTGPAGIPLSIQSGSNQFRIVSRCMQLYNYVCIFMVIPTNVQYTVESCWKHLPTSSFVSSLELHVAKSCNQGRVRSCRVMCPRAFPGQCATKYLRSWTIFESCVECKRNAWNLPSLASFFSSYFCNFWSARSALPFCLLECHPTAARVVLTNRQAVMDLVCAEMQTRR